ncbi:MAG: glucose-6-phosphate isomerase [Bacteroidota bacterium]|nr:glucose-6-phosphate isomerase [Bacteroidota bacterium]
MALHKSNPTETHAWQKLREHFEHICYTPMTELFEINPNRTEQFHIQWNDFLLDFSKNKITDKTLGLLIELAEELKLSEGIEKMFNGERINATEQREVLHIALRANEKQQIWINNQNIVQQVVQTKEKLKDFTNKILNGTLKGYTNKAFTDVINIGIGGSDLGPRLVTQGLKYYKKHLNIHYVSNIDDDTTIELLDSLNPETTLVLVVSKSFSTQETIINATLFKEWFLRVFPQECIANHFVAVSSEKSKAIAFGILPENIFPLWDWVGGRFSLWSAVGLSTMLSIGYDNFEQLLLGAHQMDEHFRSAKLGKNIPVILALLSVWYNNFFEAETHCIIPYSSYLEYLIPHLQQLIMESNGKNINRNAKHVDTQTGNIIFGGIGSNSQHAFFQLIHQGTKLIPIDFIGFIEPLKTENKNHNILISNMLAQAESLLIGQESPNEPYSEFYGDKPSNILLIQQLTPFNLGALLAMYEHKVFVEGYIWNIYSFDQWGVELGKKLSKNIQKELEEDKIGQHDPSTSFLINYFKKHK